MIPIANPQAQYCAHQSVLDAALQAALAQPQYILGAVVERFEHDFAHWCGAAHAVGVGTGTDALYLALRAHEIGAGDEVITVSHTAVATVAAIVQTGATPVLVDVTPDTLTINPDAARAAITPKTRAIIAVHLYGHPADMTALRTIAQQYALTLLEDCAQAHGACIDGQRVGTFGACGCFSFYPTKNLGAIGDGGAVVTDDGALAQRLRELREYGWRERYISHTAGWNSRLDVLQAAILAAKLPHLEAWNTRRRAIAAHYTAALADHPSIRPPVTQDDATHVFHQYVVRSDTRDALAARLAAQGIATAVHYPIPVHLQPGFCERVRVPAPLPVTTHVVQAILSLPIYPELADSDVAQISAALPATR